MIIFDCAGHRLAGSLDNGAATTGLLIVTGGNEIRSGAYSGQAAMAAYLAGKGFPVFRYDRRGVGDSEGENQGFEGSAADIGAAVEAFRREAPHVERLVALGNCDAATALALFHSATAIDALILANPWTLETAGHEDAPTPPSAAAIRVRYWARIKNPRSFLDLLGGKIDLRKLAGGLAKAAKRENPSSLAVQLANALSLISIPTDILIAAKDTTALAFMDAWSGNLFEEVRTNRMVGLSSFDTASHSFADIGSRQWLYHQVEGSLGRQRPPE
jgi:exosortase A-associated hydrolase 1